MSEPYIPNDDLEQLNYGRPKAFTPTEQARARVTKKLFPSTRDDDLNLSSIPENRLGVKVNTTMGKRIENVNTTSTTWVHRHPRENSSIEQMREGALYAGHSISSDQRHADLLLGGGTSNINYSRIQREIAHPTGTPKFCGNTGAACETWSKSSQ